MLVRVGLMLGEGDFTNSLNPPPHTLTGKILKIESKRIERNCVIAPPPKKKNK